MIPLTYSGKQSAQTRLAALTVLRIADIELDQSRFDALVNYALAVGLSTFELSPFAKMLSRNGGLGIIEALQSDTRAEAKALLLCLMIVPKRRK